jgi:transporter family protein
MSGWLLPSLAYIVLLGALGVTTKLALRDVSWHDVILWTAAAYLVIAVVMLALGQARFGTGTGDFWAVVSAVLASSALIMFYVALGRGEASRVVPLTSAYPLVTVVLSMIVLSEEVTVVRGLAALVVIAGVVLLTVT